MKKIYLGLLALIIFHSISIGQPSVLQSSLFATASNTTPNSTNVRLALNAPSGFFNQVRFLVNTVPAGTNTWAFHQGTTAAPDYSICWRPYDAAGAAGAIALNSFIQPLANINSSRCNANSGTDGNLPTITAGRYYTFNITNNSGACAACIGAPSSGGTCNSMAILETSYNPVTIISVSATTPANASNSVLITATTSGSLSSGEYVYVRYSTDGYITSSISQFSFSGTTGKALIPCFTGGTNVNYYIYSSNKDLATINSDVVSYGQPAHDMATLNLNNNGGSNYTYTQGNSSNFSGIYSAPSTCYVDVKAFVTALNLGTVNGPVTLYAIGGSTTETAPAGGIDITKTGTLANPIIFQKFGSGTYTIQASTALTTGAVNDGIFKLTGADYITIDGFTLQENIANTITGGATPEDGVTGNKMTEFGVALLRSSSTNGAQNNTIQNNTISLNRNYANTFGIYSSPIHTATDPITFSEIGNSTTAPNSSNKIYGNTISNVNMGITFIGSRNALYQDVGNDIGGSAVATGNTISNWGGAAAVSSYVSNSLTTYCIFMNHQTADNISYNTITSAAISGTATSFTGIRKDYTTTAPIGTFTTSITYNTITMSSSFTSGVFRPISSGGMGSLSTATLNINYNNILNCVMSGAASGSLFTGIFNSSAPGTLSISNNVVRGYTSTATGGTFTGINNSGSAASTINITFNQIGNASGGAVTFSVATTGAIDGIINSGGVSTTTVNLNNNSIQGISLVSSGQLSGISNFGNAGVAINMNNNSLGTATGNFVTYSAANANNFFGLYNGNGLSTTVISISNNDIRGIVNTVTASTQHQYINSYFAGATQNINNNTFTNITCNTTGAVFFISTLGNKAAGQVENCNSNSIVIGFNRTTSTGNVYFYYSFNSSVNGSTITQTLNNFSNVFVTGTTSISGWYNQDGASSSSGPTKTITSNTFSNINGASGLINVMEIDYSGTNSSVSSNSISSIAGNGQLVGILYGSNNSQGTHAISSNTISNFNSTSTGGVVVGISVNGTNIPTLNVNSNSITSLSTSGASAAMRGIEMVTGNVVNVNTNILNSFTGSGNTSPYAEGISVLGGTTVGVGYNKIYNINETGTISTTADPVNGIAVYAGTTVTVYNNFVSNLGASNANLTDAVRGININSSTVGANYNCYYNSVYMSAAGGANFGTSGIYHTSGAAGTATLKMIDNIIVNISTPNGTGVTAAYRRSNATLTNFSSLSDYNLLYAGTPSASRLIYYDGTTGYQTLSAYQTWVSTRDANSISELPVFTSPTDLHLTSANCSIDNKGTPIAGFTTDIDLNTRSVTVPDIGADEFTAVSGALAGVTGGHATQVCSSKAVSSYATSYYSGTCDLIAKILPSGALPVSGTINACVTILPLSPFPTFNAEPYVQRYYDIEPTTLPATSTATITLYFLNQEFVDFNANNGAWPDLPTVANGGNGDLNKANLKVTQWHGTAFGPFWNAGNYTGTAVLLKQGFNPGIFSVFYNATTGFWEVTVKVSGFSGFYVHTNPSYPLPISLDYLNGVKQANKHLLTWKVTCYTTPKATLTLERSADQRNFNSIYSVTADALRCQQPFNYTDAQPLPGMNYYRLKMVDADGKITYSNIIALLNATKGFALMNIAPNPVSRAGKFKLNATAATATKMELVISDMQGRVVSRQTIMLAAGYNSMDINASNLAPGTYNMYGTSADDRSALIRFVKQ